MADLPTVFSESAASRIGAATRWAELQQGIPQDGYGSSPGNGLSLVRTGTTLPAGYTGSMAVLGDVVEKQPDGTVTVIGAVWIKDINGGTLSVNTIYQARVGGTYTQDVTANGIVTPTTLGLYLVQGAGGSARTIFLRPWRFAVLEAKVSNTKTVYRPAIIWAEDNPDTTDSDVYINVLPGNYDGNTSTTFPNFDVFMSYIDILGVRVEKTDKTQFTINEIEYAPFYIAQALGQGSGAILFNKMESEIHNEWAQDEKGNWGPYKSLFKRLGKKNLDGSDSYANVYYADWSNNRYARLLFSYAWYPTDSVGKKAVKYSDLYNFISWYLKKDIGFTAPGPDKKLKNGYPYDRALTIGVRDYNNLGFPQEELYARSGQTIFYTFAPFATYDNQYLPIAVGPLPKSPMYVAPTTSGIGTGIGSGISGV